MFFGRSGDAARHPPCCQGHYRGAGETVPDYCGRIDGNQLARQPPWQGSISATTEVEGDRVLFTPLGGSEPILIPLEADLYLDEGRLISAVAERFTAGEELAMGGGGGGVAAEDGGMEACPRSGAADQWADFQRGLETVCGGARS